MKLHYFEQLKAKQALTRALNHFNSKRELADFMHVNRNQINRILDGDALVPLLSAFDLELFASINYGELRPDACPTVERYIQYRFDKKLKCQAENIELNLIQVGPRYHPDPLDVEQMEGSIKRRGLVSPIVLDQNKNLIIGEVRLLAVKALGWLAIDCHIIDINHLWNSGQTNVVIMECLNIGERYELAEYLYRAFQKEPLPKRCRYVNLDYLREFEKSSELSHWAKRGPNWDKKLRYDEYLSQICHIGCRQSFHRLRRIGTRGIRALQKMVEEEMMSTFLASEIAALPADQQHILLKYEEPDQILRQLIKARRRTLVN